MTVEKNKVVTLDFKMYNGNNELLDSTEDEAIEYLHGNYNNILPKVEEALEGKSIGDEVEVVMTPADAFGEYDEELIEQEDLSSFPDDIEIGSFFEAENHETGHVELFRVTGIVDDLVTCDYNHEFAGQTIRFVAKVVDIREAQKLEIQHGHVHSHGHHHHD